MLNRRSLIKGILGLPTLLGFRRKAAVPGFDAVATLKVGRPASYLTGANYLTAEQVADVHAMMPGLVSSIPIPLTEVSAAEAVMAEDPDLGALLQELEGQTYPVLGEDGELIWERPEGERLMGSDFDSRSIDNNALEPCPEALARAREELMYDDLVDLVYGPDLDEELDHHEDQVAALEAVLLEGMGIPASPVLSELPPHPYENTQELLQALDRGADALRGAGEDAPEAYAPPPARDGRDIPSVDTRTSSIYFQPGPVAVEAFQDDVTGEDLVVARHDVAVHGVLF